MKGELRIRPVTGVGEVADGHDLGALIGNAAAGHGAPLRDGEVVVLSQKVVSKAEGRLVDLGGVEPDSRASGLAAQLGKDPRMVQLVLDESTRIVRADRGILIVETRQGWVCANAGIDASNVGGADVVALLPLDADASARRIRRELREATGVAPAVVIADSFGRPWRLGQADVAIGCAGLVSLDDWSGRSDRDGRELAATAPAIADEVAGAADLVRAKDSGVPAAVISGLERHCTEGDGPGAGILRRSEAEDLFR
jgi:coenzyme F420-0:L-glutamate ligase/coenzyme F420-1:gamma-L-glutamate ligase